MSEIITCPNCSSTLNIKQSVPAGSRLRCPECQNIFEHNAASPGIQAPAPPAYGSSFSSGEDVDEPLEWGDEPQVTKKQGKTSTALIVVLSVIGVTIVGLMVALFMLMNNSNVTKENVAKLREGMSESQVVDILGKPDSNPARFAKAFGGKPPANGPKVLMWMSGEDLIFVQVEQGKVVGWSGRIGNTNYSGGLLKGRKMDF